MYVVFHDLKNFPQFNIDTLPDELGAAGIGYTHLEALGGRRPSSGELDLDNPRVSSYNHGNGFIHPWLPLSPMTVTVFIGMGGEDAAALARMGNAYHDQGCGPGGGGFRGHGITGSE
jgi:hypothetical protein